MKHLTKLAESWFEETYNSCLEDRTTWHEYFLPDECSPPKCFEAGFHHRDEEVNLLKTEIEELKSYIVQLTGIIKSSTLRGE